MVCWDELCECASKMHLDAKTLDDLKPCFEKMDPEFFAFAAKETFDGLFPEAEVQRRFSPPNVDRFRQLCVIANYPKMVEYYHSKHLPEQMLNEICGDFAVWCDYHWVNHNSAGISKWYFDWAQCCLNGEVRQFGRLQCNWHHNFGLKYSFYRQSDGTLKRIPFGRPGNPPHPDLCFGDKCINMHIPASGRLDIPASVDSMRRMAEFYEQYEPDYDFRTFVCYSWLLSPVFEKIMPPTSNIVQFARLGHRFEMENFDCTRAVIRRIWGDAAADAFALPDPDKGSTMQRCVARYLRDGGRFNEGLLVIMRDELPALIRKFC